MTLNSKQRNKLTALAGKLQPVFQIGKEGVTGSVLQAIDDALTARELIKVSVLKTCDTSARQVLEEVAQKLQACAVRAIGSKIILYRQNNKLKNPINLD